MKKHVMAITYKPKIEAVRDGRCTQTIRSGCRVKAGDEILLHGWEGAPYRSKWDWRKRVVVVDAIPIIIYKGGITLPASHIEIIFKWSHGAIRAVAVRDFISPATGEELRNVLFKFIGRHIPDEGVLCQIITWNAEVE